MGRNVGKLGEKALDAWASQVGITINKAHEDTHGWDYVLEFPLNGNWTPNRKRMPFDKLDSPLKCWIQVKSTDGKPQCCSVKLDNWVHLIQNLYPTFFLVCEFDGEIQCQQAYLVHVGEAYIRHVLKRLRELGTYPDTKLHKHTVDFTYSHQDILSSLDGEGLVKTIMQYVPDGLEKYSVQKQQLLKTAGYEKGGYGLKFAVTTPSGEMFDPMEHFVNFILGLTPYLAVDYIEIKDMRFGIEAPDLTEILYEGRIELLNRDKFTKAATILIYASDRRNELRIDTRVHIPNRLGFELEPHYNKIRFEAPFLDVITQVGENLEGHLNFRLPAADERHDLKHLQPVANLILILNEAIMQKGKVKFDIIFDSMQLGSGDLFFDSNEQILDKGAVDIAKAIRHAWYIAKHFDIYQEGQVCIKELLQQKIPLEVVAQVLERIPYFFKITYQSDERIHNNNCYICMPIVLNVLIGKYRPLVSFAVIGNPHPIDATNKTGASLEVITKDVRIFRTRLLRQEEDAANTMKEILRDMVREYKDTMKVLLTPEISEQLGEIN